MNVAVPKLREGTHFPDCLLERRRPAEAALTNVVATRDLLGLSTRRMDRLVHSSSQQSSIASSTPTGPA